VLLPGMSDVASQGAVVEEPEPTRLRVAGAVPVEGELFTLFKGPFRCDSEGNVSFVPYSPARPQAATSSTLAVRISADGKKTTRFSVAGGLGLDYFADVGIEAIALDNAGSLYALTDVQTRDGSRQFVVAFDADGRYKSKVEIDPEEILVDRFGVVGSGEILLSGYRPRRTTQRIVVMAAGGGRLRDVVVPTESSGEEGPTSSPNPETPTVEHVEAGPDGRLYVGPDAIAGPVWAISSSGTVTGKFALAPPKRDVKLVGIRVSIGRLAAIYDESRPGSSSSWRWIVVHDLSTGEHTDTYGPVTKLVMCYQSGRGLPDRFTLLGVEEGRLQLLAATR
jgi:hypothetical protein